MDKTSQIRETDNRQESGAAKILDHGYVALLHADGRVIFKSQQITEDELHKRQNQSESSGWVVFSNPFEKWGYRYSPHIRSPM